MMNKLLSFGGLTFSFCGTLPPMKADECAAAFVIAEGQADITVNVSLAETLSIPCGVLCYEDHTSRIFDDGERVYLYCRENAKVLDSNYAVMSYEKNQPDDLTLTFRKDRCELRYDAILTCIMIESILLRHGRAVFHAAWVDYHGKALLFSGNSGVGKSTQAALWKKFADAQTFNGDKTLLWKQSAYGLPYAGTSGICKNQVQPLHAIVMLKHGRANKLRRLNGIQAVKAIMSQIPVRKWNPLDIERALELASQLDIPVYEFCCLPDETAVEFLKQHL